jgi:hypothetical protein
VCVLNIPIIDIAVAGARQAAEGKLVAVIAGSEEAKKLALPLIVPSMARKSLDLGTEVHVVTLVFHSFWIDTKPWPLCAFDRGQGGKGRFAQTYWQRDYPRYHRVARRGDDPRG